MDEQEQKRGVRLNRNLLRREQTDRVASEILEKERLERMEKTIRLRQKRLAGHQAPTSGASPASIG
jgi:hypothetical protein